MYSELILPLSCLTIFTNHQLSAAYYIKALLPKAKHVRFGGRPDRKYIAETSDHALLAGNSAEIAARPRNPYHAIVRQSTILST